MGNLYLLLGLLGSAGLIVYLLIFVVKDENQRNNIINNINQAQSKKELENQNAEILNYLGTQKDINEHHLITQVYSRKQKRLQS